MEPIQVSHAKEMYQGYLNETVYEFIESSPPENLEWLEEKFRRIEKREFINRKGEKLLLFDWAIRLKSDHRIAGTAEYTVYEDGSCNVAYVLFEDFWRKGIGFEAMERSFQYMKASFPINKFIIECDSLNVASMKIAMKLNFQYVETKFNATQLKHRIGHDHQFVYLLENL